MEEIRKQYREVDRSWEKAYRLALANPTAWKPHLPNASLTVLNESVEALGKWIDRSRAPSGFSPGYHLAKSLAGMHLPNLLASVQQLEAGNFNHLPNFVNQLISALSAIHAMVIYAPKNEQETINADFTAELTQALSLLNTAQEELAGKASLLESSQELVNDIETSHKTVLETEGSVLESKNNIENANELASSSVEKIRTCLSDIKEKQQQCTSEIEGFNTQYSETLDAHEAEFKTLTEEKRRQYDAVIQEHQSEYTELLDEHGREYKKLVTDNKALNDNLKNMADELERLQERCRKQEEIIESIIPRGASAGLAAAFSSRGKQLDKTKWIWLSLFVASLTALAAFAWHLTSIELPEGVTFWDQLLSRLPLAAPLVWLGWFSAIQYGNIIRVQEDYAFKEATSKAYQGYKDHMEHLGNVDLDEAQTALTLLSETTIQVLGREPLRIYGKTAQDASPAHGLSQILRKPKPKKQAEPKVVDTEVTENG